MTHGILYEHTGQDTGKGTLVFLHGIGGDADSFHHQMSAFPGYRVVAWNMPGYGGSEVRKSPPDFAHLSDRLGAMIDALGGPVHLVGQSIGGMIAMDHAIRRGDQVCSLGLVATTPRFGGRDDSFKEAFLRARLAGLDSGQSMADMAAATAPHLVGAGTPHREIQRIAAGLARVPESTWRDILRCLVTFDRADDLHAITCPTLVIGGRDDSNAPPKTVEKMAARITAAQCHILTGGGHMLHQEQPDVFNARLADFLSEIDPHD